MKIYQTGKRFFPLAKLFMVAILLYGCANESTPTGGKEDKDPPQIISAYPPNKSVEFSSNKVQLTFNEFLQDGAFAQTLVSPPIEKAPVFRIFRNRITVFFKSKLKPNTTYTINFGDDIKDLNAGNIASNFTYVFSTGAYIDSQQVSGDVILAQTGEPAEGVIVSLYPADSLNGIKTAKPLYFSKTNKQGQYHIENIRAGKYNIFALKDQNFNYRYDQPNELIGFSDRLIDLTDDNIKNYRLLLFQEQNNQERIESVKSISPGLLSVSLSSPTGTINVYGKGIGKGKIYNFNTTRDSINIWYSDPYVRMDTIFITLNDSITDTVRIKLNHFDMDSGGLKKIPQLAINNQPVNDGTEKHIAENTNVQTLYGDIKIELSLPIVEINSLKTIRIVLDSGKVSIKPKWELNQNGKQEIKLSFDRKENTRYALLIPDSLFKDVFGFWNKVMTWKFVTNSKNDYGNISLKMSISDPSKNYLIMLRNNAGDVIQTIKTKEAGMQKEELKNLPAGSYYFSLLEDGNDNGIWDTGDFETRRQPEKAFRFKDNYTLKGGWDMDISLKF